MLVYQNVKPIRILLHQEIMEVAAVTAERDWSDQRVPPETASNKAF